jgi:hypothetical protein
VPVDAAADAPPLGFIDAVTESQEQIAADDIVTKMHGVRSGGNHPGDAERNHEGEALEQELREAGEAVLQGLDHRSGDGATRALHAFFSRESDPEGRGFLKSFGRIVTGGRCIRSACTRLPTALSVLSLNRARYFRSRSLSFFVRGAFGNAFCIMRMNCSAPSEVTWFAALRRDVVFLDFFR